jgi:hypothetical protein
MCGEAVSQSLGRLPDCHSGPLSLCRLCYHTGLLATDLESLAKFTVQMESIVASSKGAVAASEESLLPKSGKKWHARIRLAGGWEA